MKKAIPSIITNLPDGTEVFVFGSAKNSVDPSDLDVLVVYDPAKLAPEHACYAMKPFFARLARAAHLNVHAVILSKSEELQVQFAETEKAMPFEPFWKLFYGKLNESVVDEKRPCP
jgi:predicted nucleotidyltransferase